MLGLGVDLFKTMLLSSVAVLVPAVPASPINMISVYPNNKLTINGIQYIAENANQSYSQWTPQDGSTSKFRFETHAGDLSNIDSSNVRRSEWDGNASLYTSGTTVWSSYQFLVEPGSAYSDWNVFGQWHHTGLSGSPPLSFNNENLDNNFIVVGRNDQNGYMILGSTPMPAQGTVCNVVMQANFDYNVGGAGFAKVWLNGVQIVNYTGALGYSASPSVYWKFGIYQDNYAGTGPTSLQYCNVESGTTSLAGRITNPLTWDNRKPTYVAVDNSLYMVTSLGGYPRIQMYGKALSSTPIPASTPENNTINAMFSPDKSKFALGLASTPFFDLYNVSDLSKITTAAGTASYTNGLAWSPDSTLLGMACQSTPYFLAYSVANNSFLAAPATLPAGTGKSVAFNNNGTRFAVAHLNAPRLTAYDTTTSPWTKLTNPATLPGGNPLAVTFSTDGTKCYFGTSATPFLYIYDTTTTPWTKLANPTVLPNGAITSLAVSPDGTKLAIGMSVAPYLDIRNTSDLSVVSGIPTPTVSVTSIAWSRDGKILGTGYSASPWLTLYDTTTWAAKTLGSAPATYSVGGLSFIS